MKIPLIQIKNASFGYSQNLIFEDINLDIYEGDFVVITGANGSGKSSLLKTILGVEKLQAGYILFESKPFNQNFVAENIGWLPQSSKFDRSFPMTVGEVVELECKAKRIASSHSPTRHLKPIGADKLVNKKISELSGGELQKVMIARALTSDPRILLLDEPTNNLDKEAQKKLQDLIVGMHSAGTTILMITHNHEDIAYMRGKYTHFEINNKNLNLCCDGK